jgi:hypothetical protein
LSCCALATLEAIDGWAAGRCAAAGELGERCATAAVEARALLGLGRTLAALPEAEVRVRAGRVTVAAAARVGEAVRDGNLVRDGDRLGLRSGHHALLDAGLIRVEGPPEAPRFFDAEGRDLGVRFAPQGPAP